MIGLLVVSVAAVFAAISNYCMRRTLDAGGTTRGFLLLQFAVSLILNWALCSCPFSHLGSGLAMLAIGAGAGLLVFGMLLFTGFALARGPAGLTFASLNAATIVPGPMLALAFGVPFGFGFTWPQGLGLGLVLLGLFWAARHEKASKSWWIPASVAFSLHALLLGYMQWRCLLWRHDLPTHSLLPFRLDCSCEPWFLPGMFLAAFAAQAITFIAMERRWPVKGEWIFGILGGAANGAGAYCLVQAVSLVGAQEASMLFPLFAVGIIAFTNLWSQWLYKERVSWIATLICATGIFIGTVAWSALL
jgi:drug/metabolite transporter (DMT)-like permease